MKLAFVLLLALPLPAMACPELNGEFFCPDSATAIQLATHQKDGFTQYTIKTTKLDNLDDAKSESVAEGKAGPVASYRPVKCDGDLLLSIYEREAQSGKEIITFYFLDPSNNLHRGRTYVKPGTADPVDPSSETCRRIKH